MSDPVSNAEIEDVLSSIRRLVSTGDREKPGGVVQSGFETTNKLVLTPALRVDEADEAPTEAPSIAGSHDAAAAEDRFEFRHIDRNDDGDKARESDDEPAEQADAGDAESCDAQVHLSAEDTERDDPPAGQGEKRGTVLPDDIEPLAASDDVFSVGDESTEGDSGDKGDIGDEPVGEAEISALEDRIAGVEAAVAARDDEWEPDGETDEPYSGSEVTPMAWEDYAPEPELRETRADVDAADMRSKAFASAAPDMGTDSAESAEETAAASSHEAAEESGDEDDEADFWPEDTEEAILDEDALRDMVSEIVRQELQGALGERITRNVRKLVRREIHRALTSQEFD